MHPTEQLARVVRALTPVTLQNRLLRVSAREIAFAIRHLGGDDQARVFRALPGPMVARIREEMDLAKRRRLAGRDHLVYVRQLATALLREEAPRPLGSYVRPAAASPRGRAR